MTFKSCAGQIKFILYQLSLPLPTILRPAETWCLSMIQITSTQEKSGYEIPCNSVHVV